MALSAFNLATVPMKFVAIPALVVFAAGTGAFAAYVAAPAPAVAVELKAIETRLVALPNVPAPAANTEQATQIEKPAAKRSCADQTWPYIDNRCIAGNAADRNVRVVSIRADDRAPRAAGALVTSDTVLRGAGVAPEVDGPAIAKSSKPEKRKQARKRDRNDGQYSTYAVPSVGGLRPVIVVRPLRINADARY